MIMTSKYKFGIENKNYDNYWTDRTDRNRVLLTPIHQRIIELATNFVKSGGFILDMGVGPGQVFRKLQENNYNVFGVEISDKAFELYDFPHENIKKGDLETAIPDFAEVKEFELLVASHILHHFDNPVEFIDRVINIMGVNTKFLIAAPNTVFINHRIRYLLFGEFPNLSRAHLNFLTPKDYSQIFAVKDLRIIKKTGINHYPLLSKIFPTLFSPTLFYIVQKK